MDSIRKPAHGFTLIEVAIVVAIMTILLTLGLGLMNAQLSSTAYSVTKKRQEAIKDALIAYLGAKRRLPCPGATGTVTGDEATQSSPVACPSLGIVPFATLGLSREFAEDGWGNFFSYRIYADTTPPTPICPTGWDWGNVICFGEGKDGITPTKSAQRINDGTVTTSTLITDKSIAIIVSHGGNGLGAWVAQGTRNAAPTTCEEAHNAAGTVLPSGCTIAPNTYYKGERPENDDVVAYLTASEAIQTLVKQGAIKSATAKVNDDLQTLADMAIGVKRAGISISLGFLGSINLGGCNTSVSTPEMSAARSSPPDPWGDPYVLQENSTGNKFPICLSSKGGNSANYCQSNGTCSTTTALCRSIDEATFNSYAAKTGGSC